MKLKSLLAMIFVICGSIQSYAATSCGDASIIKDSAVIDGEQILKKQLERAKHYGDLEATLFPISNEIMTRSQQVIDFFECNLKNNTITLTTDINAVKRRLYEQEHSEKLEAHSGPRLVPTEQDVAIIKGTIEAIRVNRLANAYIKNFEVVRSGANK